MHVGNTELHVRVLNHSASHSCLAASLSLGPVFYQRHHLNGICRGNDNFNLMPFFFFLSRLMDKILNDQGSVALVHREHVGGYRVSNHSVILLIIHITDPLLPS